MRYPRRVMELSELRTSIHQESDQMSVLNRAASSRNAVTGLNSLIPQDWSILYDISNCENPLHISALLNHVRFTEAILSRNPELATVKNSSGSTALHLASAEGNLEIVLKLLQHNKDPCLFHDEEGRIPLHYAAMRGRTKVAEELIKAKPDSLSLGDNYKKTAFHFCVKYNHLETLQALVKLDYAIAGDLLNFRRPDCAGNTVLHFAVKLNRAEVIRYLL
ncbi:ankyrin repeat-containing protein At5g02620-like [Prosopis cineraria]|uniref:ankyrin repeat-containing protein At5g02620-like n=1 Tax=Prosopis cineraria TaxID=364024 RepID=UPI0024100809|nr:ankyrin repeat-containing protein At5g02620-like [Prosopis cineraria]